MVLTTLEESEAPDKARALLARAPLEEADPARQQAIMEMVATIMVYKFNNLSRSEVDAMLDLSLQQTRVYQEAREEGEERGRQVGQLQGQRSLIALLLRQKFEALPQPVIGALSLLTPEQLESLALALLNFSQLAEAEEWIAAALRETLTPELSTQLGSDTGALLQDATLPQLVAIGQDEERITSLGELTARLQDE